MPTDGYVERQGARGGRRLAAIARRGICAAIRAIGRRKGLWRFLAGYGANGAGANHSVYVAPNL